MNTNPSLDCQSCGACCASFRVDFDPSDLQSNGGKTPDTLAEPIGIGLFRMRGTDHSSPRCAALQGQVGSKVHCAIYEFRPSPCHSFSINSEACLRARHRKGLGQLDH